MRLVPEAWAQHWQEARARRQGVRGPRAWRRALLLWGGLVLALAAGLVFLFFYSAAFVVKTVTVTGAEGEVAQNVEQLANIPQGRPLARVSAGQVSKRVLGGEIRVKSVTVERDWPSTLVYDVQLREPALALRGRGSVWLADVNGVVYDEVDKASGKLPAVKVSGAPEDLSEETVQGLVELWRLRPDPAELEGELGTPAYAADGTVTLTIDRLTVVWGTPTQTEKKWSVVRALISQKSIDPQGAVAQRIDVTVPDTPVVTGLPPAQG